MTERIQAATVACNGCTLCCRSGELIPVGAEDTPPPGGYQTMVVGEIGGPEGRVLEALAQTSDGACVYVTASGCGIHQWAPMVCRVFDCAGLYASKTRRQRRRMAAADPSGYVAALYARGRELHRLRIGLEAKL
jgi:uncharacterized protein